MTLNGAIMQLVEMRENSMMPVAFKPYLDKVIETISECVEPSEIPQWIPCSEPPTEHGFYHEILLYGKDGNYAVGWYDEDYFTWDDRFDMDTPVAWKPLPEPWRGEEHETDRR